MIENGQDMGAPASPSGCQPAASAAEEASSQSGIPNAAIDRLNAWEAGMAERYPEWAVPDSKRLEIRCGDLRELRAAAATINCALTLFYSLKERDGHYAAVKVDGPLNWTITEPRSPEAMQFALETDEHAIIERMSDDLASYTDGDLERAFVLARDCLASAMSAFGQDPKGLEAKPASATRQGDAPGNAHD